MKSKYRLGDIIEFLDQDQKLVDRIVCIHISSKNGCEYWLQQYDGGYATESSVVRVVEASNEALCETWPSKFKSGQSVEFLYNRRKDIGEIDEVCWRFVPGDKEIQYYFTDGHGPVKEENILCQKSVMPIMKPPVPKSGKPSLKLLKNETKSTKGGKR